MNRSYATARWSDVRWGLAAMVALALGAIAVFFADSVRRALLEGPRIVVMGPKARGLVPGADVWVAGAKAGRILSIRFGNPTASGRERVIVDAVLYTEIASLLRGDATVRIAASALLAPPVLHIDPGTAGGGPFVFADTMMVVPNLEPEQYRALADSLMNSIQTLSGESERLRIQLQSGDGTLGRMRRDSALFARVRDRAAIVAELAVATSSTGSLPRLARDDSLRTALRRTGENLRAFAEAAPATVAALDSLAVDIDRLTSRLDRMRSNLDRGYGTLGRAMNDGEIRDQLEKLRASRDSAIVELMRNPFRWLRFRLF